ncbi:MAG TPA: plastocyanin/azurin family copper-binding protein [Gemmatimonadaceae bacterium]|nr:plastocyanin/azurin family copper-binding protein [Gemmatimonadaceae bacterium]
MIASSRREFVKAGGLALAGFGLAPLFMKRFSNPGAPEVIEMRSDTMGAHVWFDPIGLYVEPGTTARWIVRDNVHTTTAYHPRNDKHALRIPEGAVPWDSGYLVKPGEYFDVRLDVPGVYDYYCTPHEGAGMVGRIVVGDSRGPGAQPFDYWVDKPGTDGWRRVPDAARTAFPSIKRILSERRVHPPARDR